MSILKKGDKVRINRGAYNITDRRVGYEGVITRIDIDSINMPVRVEYADGNYNWTNYASVELIKAAPSEHAAIGAEILDKMVELKASIVARDNAVKLVVDQTEALDTLLAQYGLKRSEEIPAAPAPVARTAADDFEAGVIEEGFKYILETPVSISAYLTNGRVYVVSSLDLDDTAAPVAFSDNDGDDYYPHARNLQLFTRVIV